MNLDFLKSVGMDFYKCEDFYVKNIKLRKGEDSKIWIHKDTGHGILEEEKWEKEDYYSKAYRSEFSGNASGKKIESEKHLKMYENLNRKQFEQFRSKINRKTSFLEVGGSFGGIVRKVSQVKPEICHVIEPNIEDANFLKERHPEIEVFNSMLEDADLHENFYDVAVSFEVLEHVPNPKRFLEKIRKSLKSNGYIHLEVPNHNDVLLSCYDENIRYNKFFYHKAHIHYFTEKSLQDLLSNTGFEGEVSSFLMYPFFNHVHWRLNKGPQTSGTSALDLPVPTRNRSNTEKEINKFYKFVEDEYEKLVNKHMVGDCLIYRGVKSND